MAHYVEERSHLDIAAELGISADAVSMRLTRGKARLRFLLETRFAADSVAEGWVRRDDAGWRSTRLRCVDCGRTSVVVRRDVAERAVAFRCTTCEPHGLSARFPLDNPVFDRLVGGLQRPSAILARTAGWSHAYWATAGHEKHVLCTRCRRSVEVRPFERPELSSWSSRHGWYVDCAVCGEQVCCSLGGLALAVPDVRAARARDPRLRSLPVREVVRDGRPAMVVAFAGEHRSDDVSVIFERDTQRLVHVSPALTTAQR